MPVLEFGVKRINIFRMKHLSCFTIDQGLPRGNNGSGVKGDDSKSRARRCSKKKSLKWVFVDKNYWLTPSAFLYPAPKSTQDKNPQAMSRVGTGTCDGKSGEKSEPIFYVY